MKPLNRKQIENIILDILRVRDHMNKKTGGRSYEKLTCTAKDALAKKR